jgi:hypothetical protein
LDGVDAPQFIRRVNPKAFDVTLTGIGRTMVLRIPIRARGGSSGTGEISIRETTPR